MTSRCRVDRATPKRLTLPRMNVRTSSSISRMHDVTHYIASIEGRVLVYVYDTSLATCLRTRVSTRLLFEARETKSIEFLAGKSTISVR